MPAVSLSGVYSAQFFTDAGDLAANYRLYTYSPGTTTKKVAYTEQTGTTSHTYVSDGAGGEYIALNARGELPAPLFLQAGGYDIALKTPAGATVWTRRATGAAEDIKVDLAADGGAGLIGFEASATGVSRTVQDKLREYVTLEDYGAVADGATDCLAAYTAAIAAGHTVIYAPGGNYYFSAGITIPENCAVIGGYCMPTAPPQGTRFTFALATPVCVTLGGASAANGSGRLQNVSIVRAAGTIPVGSVGLQVEDLYGATVEDVMVYRHAIGLLSKGDKATQGIAYMFSRVWTGAVTDAHIVIDTVPECRFSQCRFGMNGAFDQNCNDFIRVQGGSATNAANGPNSLVFQNCQFNQGQNTVTNWLRFADQTASSISDMAMWQFDGCYVETYSYGISSDATWASIQRLQINNCTFNVNVPFLNLNSGTTVDNWTISDTLIFGSFTTAPSAQIDFLHISNVQFLGAVSLTGPTSGSTAVVADCNFAGGLTLAGTWGSLQVKGGSISSGSLTNTATGGVNIDIYPINTLQAFTPTIQFGGASSGVTYSVQQGAYRVESRWVHAQFRIVLTSKGSSTGVASVALTGLPAVTTEGYGLGNSGAALYAVNLANMGTSPLVGFVGTGPVVDLYLSGATGIAAADNTNFTNTSDIAMSVSYIRS